MIMWKKLQNSLSYYILFTQEDNFNISISDYVKIWTIHLTTEQFTSCLKDSNRILKIETNELITNGVDMLLHPESLKTADVSQDGENLRISLCKSFGYPLKLTMTLKLGSLELFFQKVTRPLLKTIQDLHCSEKELRLLLQSKDKEIEEYKAEAGDICLRYLKTKTYNDVAHMEKHTLYEINFGSISILDNLLEKSVDVPEESIMPQFASISFSSERSSLSVPETCIGYTFIETYFCIPTDTNTREIALS
ncbi:uncharacterized protein LOC110996952 isoform X2 [Pieris rapae]|uniref:uncharacterized protein LOC110996952 isoform X2 n=1 Tax=Pieris rapae TaxID=64459 RepID=UPI001E27FF35|nr:uncharacterized protein LOC110996952 isoform X2 [Pieris rapae]XP_022120555.2 uncharacterized protein LOC110996952 isoform X2 [Pieris rapae]